MGAYCSYYYNGLYIDSTKNDIDISILKIVDSTDICSSEYHATPEYIKNHYDIGAIDEDGQENKYSLIKIDKNILVDRLRIRGYSFEFSKQMFHTFLEQEIEQLKQSEYDFKRKIKNFTADYF